jgi:putative two-component system hydrogenase maturation factor HypX/HoxX
MKTEQNYQKEFNQLKVLFLCSAFNGLSQKVWVKFKHFFRQSRLMLYGSIQEREIHYFQPDLIICPFLTAYLPESIWQTYPSFIVHPGPPGDGGPSSLSWAVLRNEDIWGASIIQADKGWDSGPVWGTGEFQLPSDKSISSIYRTQVAATVLEILPKALYRYISSGSPLRYVEFSYHPKITEKTLTFDWQEKSQDILRKINAGDSLPGAIGILSDQQFRFYGAKQSGQEEKPGNFQLLKDGELLVGTGEGSIQIARLATLKGIKVRPEILLSS